VNRLRTRERILLSAIIYVFSSVSPAWSQAPPTFFGLNTGILGSTPWPSAPFGSIRLWDTSTTWNDLEPSRDVYNWSNLDGYLALAQTHKVDVLYTFGGTAEWAASGSGSQCGYTLESCYPPSNIQDWDQFVTALVAHSAGRIKYWELWNEANLPEFWTGDVATLVVLAQHAYVIIKAADPTAVVLSPSSTGSATEVGDFLNGYFSAGGSSVIDVVAFHGYTYPSVPEGVLDLVAAVRVSMASNEIASKPIWDTEGSWGLDSSLASPNDAPGYLARQFVLQWSSGVSRFYWYAWNNGSWGTLWTTSGIQPAGIAYGQVYNWIEGATMSSPCTMASDSTWTCALTRPGGYQALIVWNSATAESYTPTGQYTQYLDLAGNTNSLNKAVVIGYSPILLSASAHPAPPSNLSAVVQ
jgi:hypothetical protein